MNAFVLSFFRFLKELVSPSGTQVGTEQEDSYGDHTTTTTRQNTDNRYTPHHQSAPRHRNNDNDIPLARSGVSGRRSQDSCYDSRDAVSSDIHGPNPQHLRKGKEDREPKEARKSGEEKIRASLEAKIRQQAVDISTLKEQLRQADVDKSQMTQLLGVRTAELKSAQVFLTKADSFAGAELIRMVQSLNSEMFQGAAFMSDELEFDDIASKGENVNPQTVESAKILLGSEMFSQLLAKPPKVDPVPLQLALQSSMVSRCEQIIQSLCPLEYKDHVIFLQKIYAGIQASEEQAIAGRWRAMTHAQLRPSQAYAPHLAEDLINILIVYGLSTTNGRYRTIIQDIQRRMSLLENVILKLKVALNEGVTSVDIEPFSVPSGSQFDATYMDDAYGDEGNESGDRRDGERIMCTTDMGLRRVVKRSVDGQFQSHYDVILKPKVVLASFLMDEADQSGK